MISIITPVLNGKKFIEKNIDSIGKLKIPHEHIIVDGGSTDGTWELVMGKYPNITSVKQRGSGGMYAAIHQGFKIAKYDILAWVNCDDEIITQNYQDAVQLMNKEDIDFLYGDGEFFWENEKKCTKHKANSFGKYFLKKGIMPFLQPSSMYKKDLYESNPLKFDTFRICGDLELFMRMVECKNVKVRYFRKSLSRFLKYGGSLGDLNNVRYQEEKKGLKHNPSPMDQLFFKFTRLI